MSDWAELGAALRALEAECVQQAEQAWREHMEALTQGLDDDDPLRAAFATASVNARASGFALPRGSPAGAALPGRPSLAPTRAVAAVSTLHEWLVERAAWSRLIDRLAPWRR